MRHTISIFILWLLQLQPANAQLNHVPNSSFEDYLQCPDFVGQFSSFCAHWVSYNYATPDYFACGYGVPDNHAGHQQPLSGKAYAGVGAIPLDSSTLTPEWKEYIAAQIRPLIPGVVYHVSMYVSLGDSAGVGSSGLGAYFVQGGPPEIPNTKTLPYRPQIDYTKQGICMEQANWIRLEDSFKADKPYDKIVIGIFYNDTARITIPIPGRNRNVAYYYIDSVVVVPGCSTIDGEPVMPGTKLLSERSYQPCRGDNITFAATKYMDGFRYQWSGPSGFYSNEPSPAINDVQPRHAGMYILTASQEKCSFSDTVFLSLACGAVSVPTGFSPNGDGKNDMLQLYVSDNPDIAKLDFKVFNRWGKIVFHTNDIAEKWDGHYSGAPHNTETLAYILHVVYRDGTIQNDHGNVTIVR